MLKSDWWTILAFYESVVVWLLAIGALILFAKAKSLRGRLAIGGLLVVIFLPHIQIQVGSVYFDYLCRTQAGEHVYDIARDVRAIAQLRHRDFSNDYYDEARNGRFPPDPVGHISLGWGGQGGRAFVVKMTEKFVALYEFFEEIDSKDPSDTNTPRFIRHSRFDSATGVPRVSERVNKLISEYGYTYSDRTDYLSTLLEIKGGQTEIVEIDSRQVLAEFRGFVRTGRKYDFCPKEDAQRPQPTNLRAFVTRVLSPRSTGSNSDDR